MFRTATVYDLDGQLRRASAIVKSSGGFVHARDEWLITIEVPEDRVWQLHPLRLSFISRDGDRMFFGVDIRPVRLHVVGR